MVRVKSGIQTKRRHKKILKLAKGYWMTRHKQYRKAQEAVLHAGEYAFSGRKDRKRDFRKLWIIRMNAALRNLGTKYSVFIKKLKDNKIGLDRKILSQLAVEHPQVFNKIVEKAR
ncbi:50S ribosomal protein L20 [Candidatus Roizmanbacteria bacterium CG22_combo_CG10-13_8_21_14_all_35_9]|uniref:Large ribosomal subunit protein bL20 n=3 Tax=Candidatus Roizmaniibacteriota TaxID=1752723 RepID=A0A2M8F375_9BACT|nr:MAG: 50S ribosomal protein L20 [Candidatus Roizmanbacteria bacterium CG23_combo_of_CG06-09_8_20_14_all_35_49]PIP63036.1 MAG: 50S ribosomal protein L20 [Candidatus Roizmanbacteria bacterium CG22_combo_CG10-13_8_21_14_all_35_9]PJC33737.1 MAG: 50S ribosomal protein L20 [Candidatus Roizmanbacteria bacterium CG_4_9_14_0_2_um_filter_35_15]